VAAIPSGDPGALPGPTTGEATLLEIRGLTKRYGPVTALDGAAFTVRRGRLVGFLGPNGAGKTTTMRCVFGLVSPDAGDVRWDGAPIDTKARLRFGYMPEQRGLYPRMRVLEQLAYFAQHHGLSGRDARSKAGTWLERFDLADRAKSKLEDLSHGNQQRVQLATALVHDPDLLVLDEPFSGLDPIGIATMSEVLRERAAAGVGVVFSSHQLDLVEEVCEDVVIISRGRVVAEGAIDDLKAASGRRHLDVEVAASGGTWLDRVPGVDATSVLEREGDRVKLLVDEGVDLSALLAAAQSAGEVRRFAFEPPKLSELFMDAVTAEQPARPEGAR
jgi:ABC-2 type transport system ATP-binding protein